MYHNVVVPYLRVYSREILPVESFFLFFIFFCYVSVWVLGLRFN